MEGVGMVMEDIFYLDESPIFKEKYIIRLQHLELLPFQHGTMGSYGVLICRLLNLCYSDYLRYARDRLGAELVGKNARYITVYFDNTPEVKMFVKLLNKRLKFLLQEQSLQETALAKL